ncbi:hypothetical protein PQR02_32795 [Paraburkholderia sediminicola]|uniref:Uncharacterized protein n=1 Tax=Paraburkholderia rhynchosiae TaxID=487049 RepID=A0ACC7NL82_9BURK
MLSWQVGSVEITCVVEMLFSLPHDPDIGTHYAAPTAGHVRRDGVGFRFEVKPPDGHGVID